MEAKNWLFGNSFDFREVCNKAELEPCCVVQMAKNAIGMNNKNIFYINTSSLQGMA